MIYNLLGKNIYFYKKNIQRGERNEEKEIIKKTFPIQYYSRKEEFKK